MAQKTDIRMMLTEILMREVMSDVKSFNLLKERDKVLSRFPMF